jgi:hypothetical protein
MFIVSRNATDTKGVGIDRVFVAIPMGCSTFIDPTLMLNMLSLQREANANKDKTLLKSSMGTSVNYQSYTLNDKPIQRDFRDMTISDQPVQSSFGNENEERGTKFSGSQSQVKDQLGVAPVEASKGDEHEEPLDKNEVKTIPI